MPQEAPITIDDDAIHKDEFTSERGEKYEVGYLPDANASE